MPDRRNFTARLRKSMGYSSRLKKARRKRPMDGLETYRQDALDDSMYSIEQGQAEARKKEAAPKTDKKWVDAKRLEPNQDIEELPW
jgi:hypothetical protein